MHPDEETGLPRGLGLDSKAAYGYLNDLWMYSPHNKNWTWVGGSSTISVAGVTYTRYQLLVLPGVALLAFVGLRWFLGGTALGRQVTAVTHHREVATAMGVNTGRVTWLTLSVGAALGALGGALASPTTSFTPGIGAEMMVLSFAVVATGGLGQIGGAAIAALMIGLTRSFAVYLLPEMEVLVPYLIMVGVLLIRPEGLFSTAAARRI